MKRYATAIPLAILLITVVRFQAQVRADGILNNGGKTAVLLLKDDVSVPDSEQLNFFGNLRAEIYEVVEPDGLIQSVHRPNFTVTAPRFLARNRIQFSILPALDYGKTYLLKLDGISVGGQAFKIVRFAATGKSAYIPTNKPRENLILENTVGLAHQNPTITVTTLTISNDDSKLIIDTKPVNSSVPVPPHKHGARLDVALEKLREGRTHRLLIRHLADDARTSFVTPANIKVPGRPPSNYVPYVDFKVSTNFGRNQKPLFDIAGTFKKRLAGKDNGIFFFEPVFKADLGLGATKSANFFSLDLPIVRIDKQLEYSGRTNPKTGIRSEPCEKNVKPPHFRRVPGKVDAYDPDPDGTEEKLAAKLLAKPQDQVELKCYEEWASRPLLQLGSVAFTVGPRAEMDKRFARINGLISGRLEFFFDGLQRTVAEHRRYLKVDLLGEKYDGLQDEVYIPIGFSITPRIGADWGRKLTGEVLEDKARTFRENLDPYNIFRAYLGFTGSLEIFKGPLPIKLTVSEDLYYLRNERIGTVVGSTLDWRRLKGLHPQGKAELEIIFDPAKRWGFFISYDNGRTPPNFEYLNTVKSGVKVIY